jgi:D-beta-D-heptose 7-phosphate kinase/D-beta-D-heptose 1-phosphate adenosyltransferase
MFDRWYLGTPRGLSAEAPIPKIAVEETKMLPGGAANVAANIDALGGEAILLSGDGVIVKNRLVVGDTQLARWDENDRLDAISPEAVLAVIAEHNPAVIVIADYCKGSIQASTRMMFYNTAFGDTPVLVDTKRSPWVYTEGIIPLFFPNEMEFEEHRRQYESLDRVVKLGARGVTSMLAGVTQHLPSWAQHVKSVCGAGDVLLAGYAVAAALGCSPEDCLAYGNAAAACAVEKPLTPVVTQDEARMRLRQYKLPGELSNAA